LKRWEGGGRVEKDEAVPWCVRRGKKRDFVKTKRKKSSQKKWVQEGEQSASVLRKKEKEHIQHGATSTGLLRREG